MCDVIEFVRHPVSLLSRAACVVTMGGYNSVCDVLSYGRPALVVPRVWPRQEQYIRAKRLSALGLVDLLEPDRATPSALGAWIASTCQSSLPNRPRQPIDIAGLARVPQLAQRLLDEVRQPGRSSEHPTPARHAAY